MRSCALLVLLATSAGCSSGIEGEYLDDARSVRITRSGASLTIAIDSNKPGAHQPRAFALVRAGREFAFQAPNGRARVARTEDGLRVAAAGETWSLRRVDPAAGRPPLEREALARLLQADLVAGTIRATQGGGCRNAMGLPFAMGSAKAAHQRVVVSDSTVAIASALVAHDRYFDTYTLVGTLGVPALTTRLREQRVCAEPARAAGPDDPIDVAACARWRTGTLVVSTQAAALAFEATAVVPRFPEATGADPVIRWERLDGDEPELPCSLLDRAPLAYAEALTPR